MSLIKPEQIRTLQRKLYVKAKVMPEACFQPDVVQTAVKLVIEPIFEAARSCGACLRHDEPNT